MSPRKFVFITGGCRSGKSAYAVELAKRISESVIFVATCIPEDDEMKQRVALHRSHRPAGWRTLEEGREVAPLLKGLNGLCRVAIVDCLTVLISNLMMASFEQEEILTKVRDLSEVAATAGYSVILVSNEVGHGLVPESELGRQFRDTAGLANQIVAAAADEVYTMVSGIPLKIKFHE